MIVGDLEGIFSNEIHQNGRSHEMKVDFCRIRRLLNCHKVDCHLNDPFENFESSWFLEKVKVKNLDDNEEQVFLIRQWLDKNSEKGNFSLNIFHNSICFYIFINQLNSRSEISNLKMQFRLGKL